MPSPISPFFDRELKAEKAEKTRVNRRPVESPRRTMPNQPDTSYARERSLLPTSTNITPADRVPILSKEQEAGRMGEILRASPSELQQAYDKTPEAERPVHIIRGTQQSWANPQTGQEYSDMRTAMTGFKSRGDTMKTGGITEYQKETLSQKDREFKFKQNKERDAAVDKKMIHWDATTGFEKTQIERDVEVNQSLNEWDDANLPPIEAEKSKAERGVELRKNKRTGEEKWFNVFGKPIAGSGESVVEGLQENIVEEPQIEGRQEGVEGRQQIEGQKEGAIEGETDGEALTVSTVAKSGEIASRLRKKYEAENKAPMMGARTVANIRERFSDREPSPNVESPIGLRGYR